MKSPLSYFSVLGLALFAITLSINSAKAAPFSVSGLQPATAFTNVSTEYTASYVNGGSSVDHCRLSVDGVDQGLMTLTIPPLATVSKFHTITTAGSHTLRVTCYDAAESVSVYTQGLVTVYADTTVPAISTYFLTPVSPVAGSAVTVLANYDDTDFGSGVSSCSLLVDSVNIGLMNLSVPNGTAGNASLATTVATSGSHNITINCTDRSGNTGARSQSVTFSSPPDTSAPVITAVSPSTATVGAPQNIFATYTDNVGVTACELYINSSLVAGMTLSGTPTAGTAAHIYTFPSAGSYSVQTICGDAAGLSDSETWTINASTAPAPDVTAPVVAQIASISPIQNTAITVSATYSDAVGVASCTMYVNGVNWGTMNLSGTTSGTASKLFAFNPSGSHTVYVTCTDAAGNTGTGTSRTISVSPTTTSDTSAPVVSSINPTTAAAGSAVNITASFSDNIGVTYCALYVNSSLKGNMDRSGTTAGTASRSHTFTSAGNYNVQIYCFDAAGLSGTSSQNITVSEVTTSPFAYRLVKLACPAGVIDVNHPCKAVYYVSAEGKRHAFPNERVYFTWYTNFSGLVELNSATLASLPLGRNVTYRPGIKMVKFTTLNKVYAVDRYGTLRWVTSEAVATSLYGADWNRKIDDINDAFFTDYLFGGDITSASSFSPSGTAAAVTNISLNF